MKFTKGNLKKLEELLGAVGYSVRYEKGNFKSGYCILENKKVAVINKYYETEARINSLLDILSSVHVASEELPDEQRQFWEKIKQTEFQS
jgi:hypothetical protein